MKSNKIFVLYIEDAIPYCQWSSTLSKNQKRLVLKFTWVKDVQCRICTVTFFSLLFTQSLLHSFMCMHAYFHYTLVTSSAEDKENQHNIFPRVSDTWNNFVCRSHLIWVEVVNLSGQP